MKFTDGNWMLQPGVKAHYAAEAYDACAEERALVVRAPTRPIRHRGDTLEGPLLTVRLSSPLPDVIKVSIEHLRGEPERGPRIQVEDTRPAVVVRCDEGEASLRSGELTVCVARTNGWRVAFEAKGRVLTSSGFRGMGYVRHETLGAFVHEQLSLGVGECVYGLGERFTAFVKNGQVVETWNKDGGTGSDQAYKAVPFYLTNRGYGVLVDDTGPVSFEVASEKVSRVQFSVPGERLEYYLIHGPTPKDILRRLTALTGRPALPPAWSFGLWLTTSFTTDYDEPTVTSFIDGMAERDLPLHVFHFDCFWMKAFEWCNFQFDPKWFPDPAGLIDRLHRRGLKVCLWINPYIAQQSPLFDEGKAGGFFLRKADGGVWQSDQWQPGMAVVDFTNPAACAWFNGHLRRLLDAGVDAFKTDFGERIPTDVVYHDRSDPVRMHNHYAVIYNECVFRLLEEVRGRGEAVLFARSAAAGGQKFPVHWGGDCDSTFESMAESLRGGLSLSLCGFGFWSHDIGGFEGRPPAAIYKRWVAFGLMSSHSRLHGSSTYRVPWVYDDEACAVLRHFTKLKCRLMPYLYGAAVQAHREGVPMMRAMMLEFPGDPACDTLERQYMLGESLLVAPVLSAEGEVDYYLPSGRWSLFESGEIVEGGRWMRTRHDFFSLPLYVRENTVLAFGAVEDRPDYDYRAGVTFRIYALVDGAIRRCAVSDLQGRHAGGVEVRRSGDVYEISAESGAEGGWGVQLMGCAAVDKAEGGELEPAEGGVLVRAVPGVKHMRITCRRAAGSER
ncbi:alpha-xylosidase [Opitutales bacterium ASA1]|uniref:alpha-xylosidase n=1 Tax=Congregicoccus parvus TaxID=3081749 RepID=UPI002B31C831|nr:alpha-xylosidase [Opitutales bacterium ASA1]